MKANNGKSLLKTTVKGSDYLITYKKKKKKISVGDLSQQSQQPQFY